MQEILIDPAVSARVKNKIHPVQDISTDPGKYRIPELDGLRGIAILLVISFHYINNQLVNTPGSLPAVLSRITSFGWVGVDLFFVLSGFLIGSIVIANKNSKTFFSTFYIRRIVRIIPNYFLLILLFLVISALPFFADSYFLTGNNVIPLWAYITMCHNIFMGSLSNMGNDSMSITWSIGIEEQFYIFFPLLTYLINTKWLPYLLSGAIVAACLIRFYYASWIPPYVLPFCRMDALAFGVLLAYYNKTIRLKWFVFRYYYLLIGVMIADVLTCALLYKINGDLGTIKHSLFSIFFSIALLIALTRKNSLYAYVLRNKWLMRVGALSYSLYLFNYIILGVFHKVFLNHGGIVIRNAADIVISCLALITTFLFSWLVFNKLETPMVKLGKKFRY